MLARTNWQLNIDRCLSRCTTESFSRVNAMHAAPDCLQALLEHAMLCVHAHLPMAPS